MTISRNDVRLMLYWQNNVNGIGAYSRKRSARERTPLALRTAGEKPARAFSGAGGGLRAGLARAASVGTSRSGGSVSGKPPRT